MGEAPSALLVEGIKGDAVSAKVILIDEEYGAYGGHHSAYDLPICEELQRRNIDYLLLAARELDVAHLDRHVRPTFHTRTALRFRTRRLPQFINRVITALVGNMITFADLALVVTRQVSQGDVIVLCRPLSRTRISCALWLRYLEMRARRVTVVYVVHNEPEPLFGMQIRILLRLMGAHRLEFVAHSPAIARIVSERFNLHPTVIGLPFYGPDFVSRPHREGEPIRFTFLGLGHHNKGLDLVVRAVEALAIRLAAGDVQFAIQCYLPFTDPKSEALLAQTVELSRFVGVEILASELSPSAYLRQLHLSHVVLVPHRLEAYRFALAGTFADAVSAGRPVIVADGSYMSEIVLSTGAGLTFESGDAASLRAAMERAVAQIDVLTKNAEVAAKRWALDHGPGAFVTQVLALAGINESPAIVQ
jgi:glycosyltransferase involved in cell wall biosynthesis